MSGFQKFEPLSNFQIEDKCKELKINNFRGVFMCDELKTLKINRNECIVINIANSNSDGTYWVCLLIRESCRYYFESYRKL